MTDYEREMVKIAEELAAIYTDGQEVENLKDRSRGLLIDQEVFLLNEDFRLSKVCWAHGHCWIKEWDGEHFRTLGEEHTADSSLSQCVDRLIEDFGYTLYQKDRCHTFRLQRIIENVQRLMEYEE